MNLPDDLNRFLQSGQQLGFGGQRCETGEVRLNTLADLQVSTFRLQTYATPLQGEDPHKSEPGYYLVPAVSLVAECENYLPEFLLVWLPDEGGFGTGDEEHGHLLVFPDVTWTDIVANPVLYLEAQWNPDRGTGIYLRPWPKYPYKPYDD